MKKKNLIPTILVSVVIIAGYYLLFGARTSRVVSLNFTDTQMTVRGPEGYVWQCPLNNIQELTLISSLDAGIPIDGKEGTNYRIGKWRNTAYGDYQLCASTAIDRYVAVVTQNQGAFLFNYETAVNTEILYNSLVKMLNN